MDRRPRVGELRLPAGIVPLALGRKDMEALWNWLLGRLNNRLGVAKFVFALDAVLGILSVGGAALYGAALSSGEVWGAFLAIFVPCSVLWASFCYCAYRGLTSENAILKFVFWLYVAGNLFAFPVGTAIAGISIWLWRDLRKQSIRPVSA
jgi:hypothetical protein